MNRQLYKISKINEQLDAQGVLKRTVSELGKKLIDLAQDCFYFEWENHEGKTVSVMATIQNNDSLIYLSYYGWYEVSRWNAEEVNELQKNIMKYNLDSSYKIYYVFSDDDYMKLGVSVCFPLFAGICDINKYIKNQIDNLLCAQRDFDNRVITNRDKLGFVLSKSKYDVVVEALKNIQCYIDEMPYGRHTHWLNFWFQAVSFELYINDSQKSVKIMDRSFYEFHDDEIGEKEMVRDIVNEINQLTPLTVTYSEYKGQIVIGSKYALPCFEDSYFNDLLAYILNEFFYVRNRFYSLIAKKKVQ